MIAAVAAAAAVLDFVKLSENECETKPRWVSTRRLSGQRCLSTLFGAENTRRTLNTVIAVCFP